ncbi:glycosyltransferase involved in cell wall biosynthesis [Caulobacter ginsengisoli]|uniref:Glycosyltransferase involved in cell wall biosynthesis n=1 Tax=Caulobacter ginsengisoli TaxID=400775 RepID=A0ABU0IM82_9CAUL|nr:hypothetical protein [Caulobacter ginsengisoli]MDQ0463133.1 glycosyltransferase involved in cell wall biosynthesis [Caulobacter ginsengisoli]
MNTIIVCDWLPPAFGAVGQYMSQRAHRLAAEGGQVTLIGLGEEPSVTQVPMQTGSLTEVRIKAVGLQKGSFLLTRATWALRKNVKLAWAANKAISRSPRGKGTEIVVTGSPPFLSYVMIVLNLLLWRRTLIYRITDFYPETVFAAGFMRKFQFVGGLFHFLRRFATRIEALGEDQKRRLLETGVKPQAIQVVRDASPIEDWGDAPPAERPFPADKVLLLYSGNLGLAHDIETLVRAYDRHVRHGSDRIRLWVNGTGARLGPLQEACAERNLPLHVSAPVPIEDLPAVLRAADAHLVLLRAPFWGYVLPSKIYACVALDQPILYVGPVQSDVHLLASQRPRPYRQVDPGDVVACVNALEDIADAVQGRTWRAEPPALVTSEPVANETQTVASDRPRRQAGAEWMSSWGKRI